MSRRDKQRARGDRLPRRCLAAALLPALASTLPAAPGLPPHNPPSRSDSALACDSPGSTFGSAAAVSFDSGTLSADSRVLLALYSSERWSGSLRAYPLDPDSGRVSPTALWDAAELLDAMVDEERVILSYDGVSGIPFRWHRLSAEQQLDFCVAPGAGGYDCDVDDRGSPDDLSDDRIVGDDALARARFGFIRGDRRREAQGFRVRDSRLGDIVHSGPLVVGAPRLWGERLDAHVGDSYGSFVTGPAATRRKVVYLGANDGMLHAFDADSGEELMAYVPNALFSTENLAGLHYLSDPAYRHRYYVDLKATASDAYLRGASGGRQWRTVLIGGLRGGGRGYFALDVTDPSRFGDPDNAAQIVMWEFTSGDDPDLGYSYALPTVAMTENGRWAAIFGNGYEDLPDGGSDDGQAQLFVVYLEGGLDGSWSEGDDYIKIATGAGDSAERNGLASPGVIDSDGDGLVDRVYAGDLRGRLWVFDLSSDDDGDWRVDYRGAPLFTAPGRQPITTRPLLAPNPLFGERVMAYFGTGRYPVEDNVPDGHPRAFYGVVDDRGDAGLGVDDLLRQTLTTVGGGVRTASAERIDSDRHGGWYIGLPPGERVVTDAAIRRGVVMFNTVYADDVVCGAGGGYFMSLSYIDGGEPPRPIFDLNGDGTVDQRDRFGENAPVGRMYGIGLPGASAVLGDGIYTAGRGGLARSGARPVPTPCGDSGNALIDRCRLDSGHTAMTGRLSWEEVSDRQAAPGVGR